MAWRPRVPRPADVSEFPSCAGSRCLPPSGRPEHQLLAAALHQHRPGRNVGNGEAKEACSLPAFHLPNNRPFLEKQRSQLCFGSSNNGCPSRACVGFRVNRQAHPGPQSIQSPRPLAVPGLGSEASMPDSFALPNTRAVNAPDVFPGKQTYLVRLLGTLPCAKACAILQLVQETRHSA